MPNDEEDSESPAVSETTLEGALRYLAWSGELSEAIAATLDDEGETVAPFSVSVSTYSEAGVLTYNKGVVLRLSTGAEFQLTIVRSAR